MAELGGFDPLSTYDSASADYADASRDFWRTASERTVELLDVRDDEEVLDVACGPGWSAIAAAQRIRGGRVVAVDYAPQMLEIAQRQAADAGVDNIEWRQADMTTLSGDSDYDVVMCVLGLFFVEDMVGQARRFVQLLRPGGRLGVTVLGRRVFTPLVDELRTDVLRVRPDLDWTLPWSRLADPERLRAVLEAAGATDVHIAEVDNPATLESPDDWWRMVLGSGLRRYVTEIGPEAAEQIRDRHARLIRDRGVTSVDLDVIVSVSRRPPPAHGKL